MYSEWLNYYPHLLGYNAGLSSADDLYLCSDGVKKFFHLPTYQVSVRLRLTKRATRTSIPFSFIADYSGWKPSLHLYGETVIVTEDTRLFLLKAFEQGYKHLGVEYK